MHSLDLWEVEGGSQLCLDWVMYALHGDSTCMNPIPGAEDTLFRVNASQPRAEADALATPKVG